MSKREIQQALFGKVGRQRSVGPEALVLRDVMHYLEHDLPLLRRVKVLVWRQNTGGAYFTSPHGDKQYVRFGQPGTGDVMGLLNGVHTEIEVKALGNVPTDQQAARHRLINEKGGIAFWCDSLEMAIAEIDRVFEERGWGQQ